MMDIMKIFALPHAIVILASLIFVTASHIATAQRTYTAADSNAVRDADAMRTAFMHRDWDTFMKYIHPDFVKMVGSREKMLKPMIEGLERFKRNGIELVSQTIMFPTQTFRKNRELQAVIPMTQVMKMPQGTFSGLSHLLALSSDDGQHWTFINLSGVDPKLLRKIVPNLDRRIKIPAESPPTPVQEK
jgi:hypothetical protein